MGSKLPVWIVVVVLLLAVGGCAVGGYNNVVRMDEDVDAAWAQVETQLQRRYDLIPNLVETVKGIAAQEQAVFVGVAEARSRFNQAGTVNEKAAAATAVESALARLLAIREDYPELKSNESFLKLQDQLEGTENRLSVERTRYNDAARALNAYIRAIPGRLWASLAGVDRREYFEVTSETAREAPQVDFDTANENE